MGLLLRPDTYYTRSEDGLYLLTYEGPAIVGGGSAYPLLVRLAPYLDGRRSLSDLTANLTGQRRDMVRQLITVLIAKGAITTYGQAPSVTPGQADGYHREVSFLSWQTGSALQTFRQYRAETVAVVGPVELVPAVAAAALRSGSAQVRLLTEEPGAGWDALLTEVERGRRDPGQLVTPVRLDADADADAVALALRGAGLVLHVRDRPAVRQVRVLEGVCVASHTDLFQALLREDGVWFLSCGPRAGAGVRWSSVARRLGAGHRGVGATRPGRADGTARAVAAAQLVSRAFRTVTGAARPEPAGVTRLDPATLGSGVHAVVPHPFEAQVEALTAETVRGCIEERRAAAPLDPEVFSRRAVACMDDRLGIFGRPEEGGLGQLPLRVCEIEVSDPVGLLGEGAAPIRVFGTGLDFASARLAAGLNAFSAYGALMLDPRRLIGTDHKPIFAGDLDPDLALRDVRVRTGHLPGVALTDGRIRLVPVSRAFPALHAVDRAEAVSPGTASAYGWQEAVTTGVLAQVRRLTLDEMVTAGRPSPRLDLDAVALDPVGERYRTILAATGERVTAHDITGTLSVPTVLCQVGRAAQGCASGLSIAGALRDALAEAVVSYQSVLHGQPAYAPPPIPAPSSSSEPERRWLGADPLDLDAIVAALAAQGWQPVAVPLDHDPEVSAVMPHTVHVVVTRD
ncbi:YcaO-like family protein [Micromonospora citrea]|uniref:YcaO-like family protein n=1 Tax=Micromonospora citrea TaxID=47855 RepID=A0A1C6TST4_9ACTN|nr:YcaO-like family protein [Micromonospora citrea]SCL44840.1 YcaO-like family protein [Micromonospora citrea]